MNFEVYQVLYFIAAAVYPCSEVDVVAATARRGVISGEVACCWQSWDLLRHEVVSYE